jgi:hypothetical protein
VLELGGLVLILIILGGLALLASIGFGVFMLLVQLGVIVKKAGEPVHTDQGGYSLDQGREVGKQE